MDTVKIAELKRNARKLREVAADLKRHAPSVSVKVDALASEAEIRASNVERGISR